MNKSLICTQDSTSIFASIFPNDMIEKIVGIVQKPLLNTERGYTDGSTRENSSIQSSCYSSCVLSSCFSCSCR